MQPTPFAPPKDSLKDNPDLCGANDSTQSFSGNRNKPASPELKKAQHVEGDHVNHSESKGSTSSTGTNSPDRQKSQHTRGVLVGSNHRLMTPTGLVSTTASSLPPNWYELAVKSRAASLREAQRKMTTSPSLPTGAPAEGQVATALKHQESAGPRDTALQALSALAPAIAPKTERSSEPARSEPTGPTEPQPAGSVESTLAGGLVSASTSNAPEAPAQDVAAIISVSQQPTAIAALSSPSTVPTVSHEGEALRTEVMGPPPTLPVDAAYPPLNPMATDVPVQVPNPKRRGPSNSANGAHRKPAPTQTPVDFIPPVNINGKMPYALFQTIKKTPVESNKGSSNADRSQSESTSGDAATTPKQLDAPPDTSVPAESKAVDPLLADILTDADSVATATATREVSPDASVAHDSLAPVAAEASEPAPSPASLPPTTIPIKPTLIAEFTSTPTAALAGEAVDASPSAALRRTPSNRGASLQASQSITNAFADPMGLKKHREAALQEDARGRRSPSVGSTGGASVQSAAPVPAGGKKSGAARTIVPPPLVEPPTGMIYTPEGRLRTIPGIAGAMDPAGPSTTSTDSSLTPRLEDKGSANNDFCEACGGHGRFVCCDGCPRSFHFFCMSPPLDIDEMPPSNALEVLGPAKTSTAQKGKGKGGASESGTEINMDEMWFCNVCVSERKPKAVPRPKGLGPFGYLLPVLSQQNPKSFQLPADVRTYFKDVATANDGDYVNGAMARPVKPNKHGQIEGRDPYRLKDKNGDAVLCYRCGGTALPCESEQGGVASNGSSFKSRKGDVTKARSHLGFGHVAASTPAEHTIREGTGWRKIVSCDFCPLHWHIDCVDPPMLGMPSNLRKWMCPAHSDHVNDRRRVARIGTAAPKTLDLPIPSAKTIGAGKHFRTRVLNNGDIDIIPDPLEELMGANGITGNLQSGIKECVVVPGVIDAPAITAGGSKLTSKIRYRFPEKVIRTDFWSKLRANDASKIGSVFYVAAEEVAHRVPVRLVALEEGAAPDRESRYRPFGKRDYPLCGLDALADIAATRLVADELAVGEAEDLCLKRPSKTRQLIATALGIDLTNDDVPESSVRSYLEEPESEDRPIDSPLSSLSESEDESGLAPLSVPAVQPVAPQTAMPAPVLSEEELIKRIALEAATGVSSGDPIRLSKRKAAVAAESAIAGSPNTPSKKLRSASPVVHVTPIPAPTPKVAVPVEARPRKITLKTNGTAAAKEKHKSNDLGESEVALRTACHLVDQYAEERKEIEQLRAIRELMRLKGAQRMLEFLLSPNNDQS